MRPPRPMPAWPHVHSVPSTPFPPGPEGQCTVWGGTWRGRLSKETQAGCRPPLPLVTSAAHVIFGVSECLAGPAVPRAHTPCLFGNRSEPEAGNRSVLKWSSGAPGCLGRGLAVPPRLRPLDGPCPLPCLSLCPLVPLPRVCERERLSARQLSGLLSSQLPAGPPS